MKLNLDWDQVARCRETAEAIAHPVKRYVDMHSTLAVERAVLRLLGFEGAQEVGPGYSLPVANLIVDKIGRDNLRDGVALVIAGLRKKHPRLNQQKLAEKIIAGDVGSDDVEELTPDKATQILKPWIDSAFRQVDRLRYKKEEMREMGPIGQPLKYVLMATGDINEDIRQARSLARQGADVIAVLRSTAQSLLDYVPEGETSDGFGGTFATQKNFRLMREALDDISHELRRYVRMCQYSSGLCMPELTSLAAMEGVDYLVNDTLYGPIFRDLNIKRSLIDQHFARVVISRSGMVITTSEENFASQGEGTARHAEVLASHFINEQFAKAAGVRDDLMAVGHAFEVDPNVEDSFLHELAIAQLMRELFPRAPIKYLPAKLKEGDVQFNQVLDTLFNIVGLMTGQRIQIIGTPAGVFSKAGFQDRFAALKNANCVFKAARSLYDDIQFVTNGKVMRYARMMLESTHKFLQGVRHRGLFDALEQGLFADIRRSKDAGRGFDGIFSKSRQYYNPFLQTGANK